MRDSFTNRATGCGWVRFREPERAAAVLQRCNVTALYIVGARAAPRAAHAAADVVRAAAGSPRPVLVGTKLADVMLDCWEARALAHNLVKAAAPLTPCVHNTQDELGAAAAAAGLADGGAGGAGKPRYELVATTSLKARTI